MPDYAAAETSLEAVYKRYYPILVQRAVADVEADLGRSITPDAATAAQITAQIGARVQGVIATQQDRIATLVNTYDGDPAALKAALQVALDTSELRAGVIAVTETRHVVNQGRVLGMQSAGLQHVLVQDGDKDEPCAAVNNTRQTLAWAMANPLGHPNCQRSFEIDPDEAN
jgi:hypothetical protein